MATKKIYFKLEADGNVKISGSPLYEHISLETTLPPLVFSGENYAEELIVIYPNDLSAFAKYVEFCIDEKIFRKELTKNAAGNISCLIPNNVLVDNKTIKIIFSATSINTFDELVVCKWKPIYLSIGDAPGYINALNLNDIDTYKDYVSTFEVAKKVCNIKVEAETLANSDTATLEKEFTKDSLILKFGIPAQGPKGNPGKDGVFIEATGRIGFQVIGENLILHYSDENPPNFIDKTEEKSSGGY